MLLDRCYVVVKQKESLKESFEIGPVMVGSDT